MINIKFSLQLAALSDFQLARSGSALATALLHSPYNAVSFDDLAENAVLAIQPSGFGSAKEELGAVCVRPSVGHRQDSGSGVLQLKVFVGEFVSVDGFPAGTVAASDISSLAHEVGNHAVEGAASIGQSLISTADRPEILSSLRDYVHLDFHHHPSQWLVVGSYIEEALWVGFVRCAQGKLVCFIIGFVHGGNGPSASAVGAATETHCCNKLHRRKTLKQKR